MMKHKGKIAILGLVTCMAIYPKTMGLQAYPGFINYDRLPQAIEERIPEGMNLSQSKIVKHLGETLVDKLDIQTSDYILPTEIKSVNYNGQDFLLNYTPIKKHGSIYVSASDIADIASRLMPELFTVQNIKRAHGLKLDKIQSLYYIKTERVYIEIGEVLSELGIPYRIENSTIYVTDY